MNTASASAVIVTDLDGTLLDDRTYEPGPALAALRRLREAGVLVVTASSKTRAEQEALRVQLGLDGPFIVENGAAVVRPEATTEVLGRSRREVREVLRVRARQLGVEVEGFADLTDEQVAEMTGLDVDAAARARDREYSECFRFVSEADATPGALADALRPEGLRITEGSRFWTVTGDHDKGDATATLLRLLELGREAAGHGRPPLYAIGDHHNDAQMLARADVAMQVQRPDGSWTDLGLDAVERLEGVGPEGWCLAAARILADLGS